MTGQATRSYTKGTAPGALPVLGHAQRLRSDPLSFLRSLPEHGDLVKIMVGPTPMYIACHPDLVHEMLTDKVKDFVKGGPVMDRVRTVLGDGLVTVDGLVHRKQRRLIQPSFHPARIAEYVGIMQKQAAASAHEWPEGEKVDLLMQMGNLSADVALSCLFSEPGEGEVRRGGHHGLPTALNTVIDGMFFRMLNPLPALSSLPTPGNQRYKRAEAQLHQVVNDTIERYRRSGDGGGLLRTMMTEVDADGHRFTDQELHDQSITLLLGGAETTAVLMSWIFHLLHENPQVTALLHAELDEVLDGRPVTAEDLKKLPYTRNVVAEGLRLYPPAWLLSRRAATDTTLGGLPVPAGTELSYSPFLLNRDARYFDAPDSFEPDRWNTLSTTARKGDAYLPFGAGNRKCIGDVFALTEAQVIVATVAQYWRLDRAPGTRPTRALVRMSLRPDQFTVVPTRRQPAREPQAAAS
ncbi:cytochrome P450 [Streptomyces sp. NPDC004779]|uniref:cytochrome P450 n=1 Tax=Streptomyces sp. NPDC056049 TaxID=3345693 RepID=UPI0035DE0A97